MRNTSLVLLILLSLLGATKTNIAVLELNGNGVSADDVAGLSNRLRVELFKTGNYTIVERSMMKEILEEHEFQNTGCTDSECAVQIGQILNVDKMVAGSVDKVGSVYSISIRIIDVTTGKIEKVANDDCINCDIGQVLVHSIGKAAKELTGTLVTPVTQRPHSDTLSHKRPESKKSSVLREFLLSGGIIADFPANSIFSIGGEAGFITRRGWIHTASFAMGDGGNNAGLMYNLSKEVTLNDNFSFAPGISLGYKNLYWQEETFNDDYWQNKEWFSTIGGAHLRLVLRGKHVGLSAKTGLDLGSVNEENHPDSGDIRENEGPSSYFAVNVHQALKLSFYIPKR